MASSGTYQLSAIQGLGKEPDTVTVEDLVGQNDLVETWQFNFEIDPEWFIDRLHPDADLGESGIRVFHGMRSLEESTHQLKISIDGIVDRKMLIQRIWLPDLYASHHTKMMVNFFRDDTVEVVVHTGNLIAAQWRNVAQAAWRSGRIPRQKATKPSQFRTDLGHYLAAYRNKHITELATKIREYDFGSVVDDDKVVLIGSVPGNFEPDQLKWGLGKLRTSIDTDTDYAVCQISALSSQCLRPTYQKLVKDVMRTHKLKVVYPTVEEVAKSFDGYVSGGSIFYNRKGSASAAKTYEETKKELCHWKGERCRASPHIKTYVGFDAHDKPKWYLCTSANMSPAAWGIENKSRKTFWIKNYELGVLMKGPVVTELPLPYDLPLLPYSDNDEAWTGTISYNKPDIHGRYWHL